LFNALEVLRIRELSAMHSLFEREAEKVSPRALAKYYGVSYSTIQNVIHERTYSSDPES